MVNLEPFSFIDSIVVFLSSINNVFFFSLFLYYFQFALNSVFQPLVFDLACIFGCVPGESSISNNSLHLSCSSQAFGIDFDSFNRHSRCPVDTWNHPKFIISFCKLHTHRYKNGEIVMEYSQVFKEREREREAFFIFKQPFHVLHHQIVMQTGQS